MAGRGDQAATVVAWACVVAGMLAAMHDRAAPALAWGGLAVIVVIVRRLTRSG